MPIEPLESRLAEPGPKRLLALDGGGIRGLVTLGFLAQIEAVLRERYQNPDLVLSDYYDLVGGTSTGSIIAAALALGWPVQRIRKMYLTLGEDAFKPKRNPMAWVMAAKFDEAPLIKLLKERLGDITLDSDRLKIGLCVIAKRADTASVWVMVNLPGNKYFDDNRNFKLWQVIRASTAAPLFFVPQEIQDLGDGKAGIFVDGGVSMHLNPALQLLMVANLDGFGLRWPLGGDRIQLTSVGTGSFNETRTAKQVKGYSPVRWLPLLLKQMMRDGSELNQTILQWMSQSPTAQYIDSQIEDLSKDQMGPQPLITYQRYDVELTQEGVAEVGMPLPKADVKKLRNMSDTSQISRLDQLGQQAAEKIVLPEHFVTTFDRTIPTE